MAPLVLVPSLVRNPVQCFAPVLQWRCNNARGLPRESIAKTNIHEACASLEIPKPFVVPYVGYYHSEVGLTVFLQMDL